MKLITKLAFPFYLAVFLLISSFFPSCYVQQRVVTERFDVKKEWPVVKLTLNGKPAYFLLDTGANETILDASDSKVYKFVQLAYGKVGVGIGGYSVSVFVDSAMIRADNALLKGDYTAQDLSEVFSGYEKMTGRNLVGIIGNDIMKGHNVIIDYSKMTVTFSNFTIE